MPTFWLVIYQVLLFDKYFFSVNDVYALWELDPVLLDTATIDCIDNVFGDVRVCFIREGGWQRNVRNKLMIRLMKIDVLITTDRRV